jgi:N-acetylneuraminic acid mutarotase
MPPFEREPASNRRDRRTLALISFAVFLTLGSAVVKAQSQAGTWVYEAALARPRAEVAAVALGGSLHAIGGVLNNVSLTTHDAYDPKAYQWRALAPLPEARDHVAVAEAQGKIFAFGGFSIPVHKGASADAFEYDPATDSWRKLTAMPTARGSAGAAVVDGKIHVIGGRGPDGATVAAHEVYDPQSDQWTKAAALPLARDHLAVIAAEGKIHVIGGRTSSPFNRTAQHDVYDPGTGQWSSGVPLPTPRSGVAAVWYAGQILVLGGELPPDHTFPENEAYDPKTNSWTTLAPMPHGRHGFGGGVIGGAAYFVGGSLTPGDGGATEQVIRFQLP